MVKSEELSKFEKELDEKLRKHEQTIRDRKAT